MQQLEYEDASGTATLITAVYQFVAVMVAEGPQDETALKDLTLRWQQASSLLTGKEVVRQEQALWDQISIIMEQYDDCLCSRKERMANLFTHQPAAMRTHFEDALLYNNEKWRLLQWDAITEYYITAHSRFTAGGSTGTTGEPPGQDKPGHQPQGKQYCKIHGDNHTHTTKQCRLKDEPYSFDADACEQYRKKGICVFYMRGMCKRPTCDLQHITKAQAMERGLPPITRDVIIHPVTQHLEMREVPTEPQPDFETKDTNHLPTYDEPEMFFTIFDSVE